MHRFFVPPESLRVDPVVLVGPIAHQIAHVLRLRADEQITLLDDSGWAYVARIGAIGRDRVDLTVHDRSRPDTEPRSRIVLHQALPKAHKLDLVLTKCTELGVSVIAPMLSERCVAQHRKSESRDARWRRIIQAAAEQSQRTRLPELWSVGSFDERCQAWRDAPESSLALMPAVGAQRALLSEALASALLTAHPVVHLFIGPEGGFSPAEIELAEGSGVVPVSLGPRVLRTETAGIVSTALCLYALGDLG